MVLPLLKVGRSALKTIGKPFSTVIKKESNDRITKTMQQRFYGRPNDAETRNLNKPEPELTPARFIVLSVGVVALIYEWRRCDRLSANREELGELLSKKTEALVEKAKRGRVSEAKSVEVSEAKSSRD